MRGEHILQVSTKKHCWSRRTQPELLADYLREALAATEDQAWFWSKEWQAGERESENDLTAERYQAFDTMEDLLDDLGWPQ